MSVSQHYVSSTCRRLLALLTSPVGQVLWSTVSCFMLFCSKHRRDWNLYETYNPLSSDLIVFNERLGISDTNVQIEHKNRILVVMMTVIPDSTTSLLCTYSSSVDLSRCSSSTPMIMRWVTMSERAQFMKSKNPSLPESAFVYHKLDPVILALNREYFVITTGRNPLTSF